MTNSASNASDHHGVVSVLRDRRLTNQKPQHGPIHPVRTDRTELLFALAVFLLVALIYETGEGNTPEFAVTPVLLILFLLSFYVAGAFIVENVVS